MIQETNVAILYEGDGSNRSFSYPYAYSGPGTIKGYLIRDDTITEITANYQYDDDTKIYTYPVTGDALAAGAKIMLRRETPVDQLVKMPTYYPFPINENAHDKAIMIEQEHRDKLNRSLYLPPWVSGTNTMLPVPSARSSIMWDDDAKKLVSVPNAQDAATAAANSAADAANSKADAKGSEDVASGKAEEAKNWATKMPDTVDGNEHSAKYYAVSVNTALNNIDEDKAKAEASANTASEASETATTQAGIAKDWAIKTDSKVDGAEYSSKYYAQQSSSYAESASNFATTAGTQASNASTSATNAKTSETNASTSSASAAASASDALSSKNAAATSASSASTSATNAATSAQKAQNAATGIGNPVKSIVGNNSGLTYTLADSTTKSVTLDDMGLGVVYKSKGSVPTFNDLPTSGRHIGDVYNVQSTGDNYAWTVDNTWDSLGGIVDLSDYSKKEDTVKSITGSGAVVTVTPGSGASKTITINDVANATHASTADSATSATSAGSATKASQDASGNVIETTYAKTSSLSTVATSGSYNDLSNKPASYVLPTATSSILGGVKTGSNITNTSGTLSITGSNVTSALGFTPISSSSDITGNADTATKATGDSDGNKISATYQKKPVSTTVTLASASWSSSTYTISNASITSTSTVHISTDSTTTSDQYDAYVSAKIVPSSQSAGSIIIKALGTVPTVDIPVLVTIFP